MASICKVGHRDTAAEHYAVAAAGAMNTAERDHPLGWAGEVRWVGRAISSAVQA